MKQTRWGLALFLALAAAACTGGDGGPTTTSPQPEPGVLTVNLTTPNPDDRALVVEVTGPAISGVTAANAAYVLHSRAGASSVRVAVFGALGSGALLRFQVPDVNKASAYSATVVEVADAANALRETAGYTAVVAR
ncbi:MAG TPA: hypothetical protein VFT45_06460 [Longimicrobium sp.]|nr:hypothetical protein [Longimicrobium sp.]